MHWNGWGGNFGMGWGFGWLFMVVFWALVVLGIIYLVRASTGSSCKSEQKETAEEILKKRFARGEINKTEFEEAKKLLKKQD